LAFAGDLEAYQQFPGADSRRTLGFDMVTLNEALAAAITSLSNPAGKSVHIASLHGRPNRNIPDADHAKPVRDACMHHLQQGGTLQRIVSFTTPEELATEREMQQAIRGSGQPVRYTLYAYTLETPAILSSSVVGDEVAFLGMEDTSFQAVTSGIKFTSPSGIQFCSVYFEQLRQDDRVLQLTSQSGIIESGFEEAARRLQAPD
jgi:hypothetical protein